MNVATPRGRVGGFPDTPVGRQQPPAPTSPTRDPRPRASLPPAPEPAAPTAANSQPLIPLTVIDAPTQRFYACAIYAVLCAWKVYDWLRVQDDGASGSYFFKWAVTDAIFLFSLPQLRIPWLELSSEVVLGGFMLSVIGDWWLMYNIPLPFQGAIVALLKVFYDKEMAISEHNVKVANILQNSSLIMGKQIINILPEGYGILTNLRYRTHDTDQPSVDLLS